MGVQVPPPLPNFGGIGVDSYTRVFQAWVEGASPSCRSTIFATGGSRRCGSPTPIPAEVTEATASWDRRVLAKLCSYRCEQGP